MALNIFGQSLWLTAMNPLPRLASACIAFAVFATGLTAAAQPAKIDLGPWPAGASPQEIGRRVVDNFLPRPHRLLEPNHVIHYAEVCTWYGALTFTQLSGDRERNARLVSRFAPFFGPEAALIPRPVDVDCAVFGIVPLELAMQTKDPRYLKLGREIADQQWGTPAVTGELSPTMRANIDAGLSWHTRFWLDDMYMIPALETQAYRATGDLKYLDRASREAVAYLTRLQQPNGLIYHAPDVPYYWGRGDGWFAAGMSELLSALPENHPNRASILASYRKMMATLLQHQDADGMWHELIDDPQSFAETSCTGMFAFAFITGVKNGWLDEKTYGPAARKAWLKLITYLNDDGNIREVCAGTGAKNDHTYYLTRPRVVGDFHGQAPLLWCASALLR
jgi:rhamnogalacturonyl hydrolase YesR